MISVSLMLRRIIGVVQVICITLVASVAVYSVAEVTGQVAVATVIGFVGPVIVISQKNWIGVTDERRFSFYLMVGFASLLVVFNLCTRLPSESILECFFALGAPVISYIVCDIWLFFVARVRLIRLQKTH
jgi:hypothetical protein